VETAKHKVLEHGLRMTILDAEFQFDKKKLTFYYESDEKVDFRELVRDLYKLYRARIWMSKTRSSLAAAPAPRKAAKSASRQW
jgi:cell fate regulator YaaT (PSP1 superfamily)